MRRRFNVGRQRFSVLGQATFAAARADPRLRNSPASHAHSLVECFRQREASTRIPTHDADLFVTRTLRRKRVHGLQRLAVELRVIFKKLFFGPSFGHQPKQEIHGEPGAADYRLADQHGRIATDVIMPVQRFAFDQYSG